MSARLAAFIFCSKRNIFWGVRVKMNYQIPSFVEGGSVTMATVTIKAATPSRAHGARSAAAALPRAVGKAKAVKAVAPIPKAAGAESARKSPLAICPDSTVTQASASRKLQPKSAPAVSGGSGDAAVAFNQAQAFISERVASRSTSPVVANGRKLLTEKEVLESDAADYMNSDHLAFFRYRLESQEREISDRINAAGAALREGAEVAPDPADRATQEEERSVGMGVRDRDRAMLRDVRAAIARIDSGDYGYCEESGEEIGIPRLLANPTAACALEAQRRREAKNKIFAPA